jgi:hypothetical protein
MDTPVEIAVEKVNAKVDQMRAERDAAEAAGVRLPAPLLQAVVDYLMTRPYREVADLIGAIKAAVQK